MDMLDLVTLTAAILKSGVESAGKPCAPDLAVKAALALHTEAGKQLMEQHNKQLLAFAARDKGRG
jgi:hypothetical protein